ncbi:MAG: hypothetical protein P9L99_15800 [Candidatus Lernaella stagnicola]|nr:hypothetical protein [Candidatus Lernaella stagnicola]
MRRLWALWLLLAVVGCAGRTPQPALLPPASDLELRRVDLPDFGMRISIPVNWAAKPTLPGNRVWIGPRRARGRADLRLVTGTEYRRPLEDLVVGLARMRGVATPTGVNATTVAGHEAMTCSGHRGGRRMVAFAWQEDERTTVIVASWIDDEDGAALATMIATLAER